MSKYAIIPSYNEEKNIEELLKETEKLEITPVVVDDGSTDDTFKVSADKGALVIKHDTNKGKGEAIKTGLEYLLKNHPEFEHVVVMDADMQYHPEETSAIFNALENNNVDFVMGHRDWSQVPFRHKLGNFVWRVTFNTLFNTNFKDTNCGLIGFDRKAAEKIKNHILGGYIVDNSIMIGAIKNNLKINQVPVKVKYHRISKVPRGMRMVLGVFLYILREGLRYRIRKK